MTGRPAIRLGVPSPLQTSLTLGALPSAVACARLHSRNVMYEWNLPSVADSVELVVSELVTNAILAATELPARLRPSMPVIHLRLLRDEHRVVIEVWDGNPQTPTLTNAAPDEESGRGLMLVDALSERWGSEVISGWAGKVVWAEVRGD